MSRAITWQIKTTPVGLRPMLKALAGHYPAGSGEAEGIPVVFEKVRGKGVCEVTFSGRAACVRYATPSQAGRAVGALSASPLRAYRRRDRKALQAVKRRIVKVVKSVGAMEESFRTMWMSHNKPEGIETIQARFGMLTARYRELDRRLWEYLRGDIRSIPELNCKCPPK